MRPRDVISPAKRVPRDPRGHHGASDPFDTSSPLGGGDPGRRRLLHVEDGDEIVRAVDERLSDAAAPATLTPSARAPRRPVRLMGFANSRWRPGIRG